MLATMKKTGCTVEDSYLEFEHNLATDEQR